MRRPTRDHWTLYLLCAGSLTFDAPTGTHRASAVTSWLVPPGMGILERDTNREMRTVSIGFDVLPAGGWSNPLSSYAAPVVVTSRQPVADVAVANRLLPGFPRWRAEPHARVWARALVEPLLLRHVADGIAQGGYRDQDLTSAPDWLREAAVAVEQRFRGLGGGPGSVSLDQVAHDCGVSRRQLSVLWRRHFGMTAKAWIERIRLRYALRLIGLSNHASIDNVARRAGYPNRLAFWRQCRAITGKPPSAFIGS